MIVDNRIGPYNIRTFKSLWHTRKKRVCFQRAHWWRKKHYPVVLVIKCENNFPGNRVTYWKIVSETKSRFASSFFFCNLVCKQTESTCGEWHTLRYGHLWLVGEKLSCKCARTRKIFCWKSARRESFVQCHTRLRLCVMYIPYIKRI